MQKTYKKFNFVFVLMFLFGAFVVPSVVKPTYAKFSTDGNYKSAVLIERKSGDILFDDNCHERLPIASVTKLMTILLTLEELDSGNITLEDDVKISSNASGMGGSQIFLDADENYKLGELLKSVIVASANDSSVALAEYIAGSENNFVRMMNSKAIELNLKDTNYTNCTGLPTPDGYSSAFDQAVILNKVLNYDIYHNYSSIWMEDFAHPSGRTTMMTNTNKLSRYYSGCIGGKTGSTNQAKYCLAVGAERNDMGLISVVLGAESTQARFKVSSDLLNYGFENFESKTLFDSESLNNKRIEIKGQNRSTGLKVERAYNIVCEKGKEINFSVNLNLPSKLTKCYEGQVVGNAEIIVDGELVDTINILATENHNSASIWDYIKEISQN